MAKLATRVGDGFLGDLLAQVFATGDRSKSTGKASISFYSSTTAMTCPLCHTKVKAKTLHKCQKESK